MDEGESPKDAADAAAMSPKLQEVHEQLQVHIQTIGILVSEKTDLQVQLQQSTAALNKKKDDLVSFGGVAYCRTVLYVCFFTLRQRKCRCEYLS